MALYNIPVINDWIWDTFDGPNIGLVTITGKPLGNNNYKPVLQFGNNSSRKLFDVIVKENTIGINKKIGDVPPYYHEDLLEIDSIYDNGNYYLFYITQNEEIFFLELFIIKDRQLPAYCSRVGKWNMKGTIFSEVEELAFCTNEFPISRDSIKWKQEY